VIGVVLASSLLVLTCASILSGETIRELPRGEASGAGNTYSYELVDRAPRAYLAGRLFQAASAGDAFSRILTPTFRIGREAVIEVVPRGWNDAGEDEELGSVTIAASKPGMVLLDVRTLRETFLVLNDTFYPGWVARIDGEPQEIHRANHLVRGVFVPSGQHRVEFSYEPRSFRIGLVVSAVAAMILVVIAAGPSLRRRVARRVRVETIP